jgi:hypothetical protein
MLPGGATCGPRQADGRRAGPPAGRGRRRGRAVRAPPPLGRPGVERPDRPPQRPVQVNVLVDQLGALGAGPSPRRGNAHRRLLAAGTVARRVDRGRAAGGLAGSVLAEDSPPARPMYCA